VVASDAGIDDDAAMRLAIEEAARALAHDDVPVGAVAVADGRVIGSRHNERERLGDPTAHAELLLLRDLANRDGWRLGDVTIVVTLEPCAMCAGAMVNARLGRLVYGAFDPRAGAAGSIYNLLNDPRLNHEVPVTAGVLEAECAALLTAFFGSRRERDQTISP
jgi:tRNA(adenine34) deaminase